MGAETKESLAADGDSGEGLVDLVKVAAWMDEHTPEAGSGPLTATRIPGGATNAVFLLDRGGVKSVLRRPPRVPRPDNEKVLAREARVLGALNGSDVPAPRFMGHCADPAVNGTSFYIMSFAEGWVALGGESAFPPAFQQPGPEREKLAYELVDGIIKLANVDYKAVGLDGFGKPDNFLERQVDRWLHQLESYRETDNYQGRDLPGLAYVSAWLKDNLVKTPRAGIIHGDYGFANAIFAYGDKAKLVAMIDWELSTVGDPLLDLGWVTSACARATIRQAPSARATSTPSTSRRARTSASTIRSAPACRSTPSSIIRCSRSTSWPSSWSANGPRARPAPSPRSSATASAN